MLYFTSIFITSSDVLVVTFVGVPSVGGQAVQSILVSTEATWQLQAKL